ncbi:MAG: helix-turn-helix domain-containing protein [Clostridia bacterium]|nr:helix-turn-helix domain-containing protein [Clostridia bacterium]
MVSIAERIKALRQGKRVTQSQLADALGVSAQSVSKWETGVSVPDISVLPLIARYFGITMDDLFGYRLDALGYKQRFIRFMADNGMLRLGQFRLQSGRLSPYLIHSGHYRAAGLLARLGAFFAEAVHESAAGTALLLVNEAREVPLAVATAMTLYTRYGSDVEYRQIDELTPGEIAAERMTLITDTFTSGQTLQSALAAVRARCGCCPREVIVSVDRMEQADGAHLSARRVLEREFGVHICSIVTFDDILQAIDDGIIAGTDYIQAMREYRAQYVRTQCEEKNI